MDVSEVRTHEEYRRCRDAMAVTHTRWLRSVWFAETTNRDRLRGYCAICRAWTRFVINRERCYEVDGHSTPWWRETLRCPRCSLNNRMRMSVHLFEDRLRPPRDARIYLTEQVTPLYARIASRFRNVVGSEFLSDSTPPGAANQRGIRREDLTALTFPDAGFDFVLSLEVLEHIPAYRAALRECARVLRPGGILLLTTPFDGGERNLVRARLDADGRVQHLEPPEHHGDPLSSEGCLCFYHFGWELVGDLSAAGFRDVTGVMCWSRDLAYIGENLVQFVARR